ncbi:class I SAM-dependent methyltransferase [Candidatus Thorarchaeota archaeon]|nr:MAG: class I SAM-dependent methyltransferase [Candidatus Thorarchaeota archaeon]
MKNSKDLLTFLQDCLRQNPGVAEWDLIHDTQTKILIMFINGLKSDLKILDYGCGNLRVLNALISKVQKSNWSYVGYDPNFDPSALNSVQTTKIPKGCSWSVVSHKDLMEDEAVFDYVLVQNVLHEIGRFQTAALLQDCRTLLNNDGSLLLLETPLLPKGEADFVPYYHWDTPLLFFGDDFEDLSTRTPKGLPVMFFRIGKKQIPCYRPALYKLTQLLENKQKLFAELAQQLTMDSKKGLEELTHLGLDAVFDYGYLNVVLGNITRRLHEKLSKSFTETELNSAGADVVDMLKVGPFESWSEIEQKLISECEVYARIGRLHGYELVCQVLKLLYEFDAITLLTGFAPMRICPTWAFQELELMGGGNEIRKEGLRNCLTKAINLSDP